MSCLSFFVLELDDFVHLQNRRHFKTYNAHFRTASAFRRMVGVLVISVLSLFSFFDFSLSVLSACISTLMFLMVVAICFFEHEWVGGLARMPRKKT